MLLSAFNVVVGLALLTASFVLWRALWCWPRALPYRSLFSWYAAMWAALGVSRLCFVLDTLTTHDWPSLAAGFATAIVAVGFAIANVQAVRVFRAVNDGQCDR